MTNTDNLNKDFTRALVSMQKVTTWRKPAGQFHEEFGYQALHFSKGLAEIVFKMVHLNFQKKQCRIRRQ